MLFFESSPRARRLRWSVTECGLFVEYKALDQGPALLLPPLSSLLLPSPSPCPGSGYASAPPPLSSLLLRLLFLEWWQVACLVAHIGVRGC